MGRWGRIGSPSECLQSMWNTRGKVMKRNLMWSSPGIVGTSVEVSWVTAATSLKVLSILWVEGNIRQCIVMFNTVMSDEYC